MKKHLKPWERQVDKGESPDSYQLFWVFVELGLKRTLQGVAEESGLSLGHIGKLSMDFKWAPRARAFDKHLLDIQLKVIESKTKSEAVLWAERETEYRHESYNLAVKLKAKALQMLEAPLYEQVVDTFTDVVGEGGKIIQVPTKIIQRPVKWSFKDMVAMGDFADKLERHALGLPSTRIAVDTTTSIADPAQRLVQAKTMMLNWINTKLDAAVQRVCQSQPGADPNDVREKLLAEVPLWFAENYEINDVTALIEALPALPAPTHSSEPLLLEDEEVEEGYTH